MADVIQLENITKSYGDKIKTQVLFGIDLAFAQGSFNAIIGESGSGKSTLMNIMGTLDRPSSGKVTIAGVTTDSMNSDRLAKLRNETIGFIFQFHYLLPEFTVWENVLLPWQILGRPIDAETVKRADEILDIVGLRKVKNNRSTDISGGQQQRTAVARSLINRPRIILADEPTGNLDSQTTETVYQLLRTINRELGTTFVVITHDKRVAEKADRILEIKDGRIEMDILSSIR